MLDSGSKSFHQTKTPPATDCPPQHTILTLPPEVFEMIAQNASKEDLLNLRKTNRQVENQVFKTFGERLFSAKSVMLYSEDSLRRLEAICKDRRIGPYLKTHLLCPNCFRQSLVPRPIKATSAELDKIEEAEDKEDELRSSGLDRIPRPFTWAS
jgi:hypothetical protein